MKYARPTYPLLGSRPFPKKSLLVPKKFLLGFFVFAAMSVANSVDNLAVAQSSVNYEIGESARLLEASIDLQRGDITQSQFNAIQFAESCKSPSVRLQNRNRPWMSVWNTSGSADDIVTVTVDLTETGFEFGDGDMAGDGFDGLLSMLSSRSDAGVSLDSANYGSGGTDTTELILNFAGLSQGFAAIFRIDLDEPGGMAMFPDYREAMLGADTGSGPGQLATMTTDFSSGASNVIAFVQATPLSSSGIAQPYHGQSMSAIVPSVPEPTTLVLLLAGLTGIAAIRRRV